MAKFRTLLLSLVFGMAFALAPAHANSRFVVMPAKADQTVLDGKLEWQRMLTDGKGKRDLGAATKHCKGLKLRGTGWRVPTIDELESILDKMAVPTIDKSVFPDTTIEHFYTSTLEENGEPLVVNFHYGNRATAKEVLDNVIRVRCVRDVKAN